MMTVYERRHSDFLRRRTQRSTHGALWNDQQKRTERENRRKEEAEGSEEEVEEEDMQSVSL
jgi:hypothetical protein